MVERSIGSGKNILNDFGFKVFCLISFSEKKEGVNVSSAEKYTKRSSVLQTTALGILFCGTDVKTLSILAQNSFRPSAGSDKQKR